MDPDARRLLGGIRGAISSAVPRGRIGVAFSGGVDSSLVAKVCGDMGYDVTLLTVGFPGSHDIGFAREINGFYGYPHEILEIDDGSFGEAVPRIRGAVRTDDPSWNGNAIAFYYVSRLAAGLGIRTVVTANGIDELFCGYDAYRRAFGQPGGPGARIDAMMDEKLGNEIRMMRAVAAVSAGLGVSVVQPLLSPGFVRLARSVPVQEKITGGGDMVRKHAIRRLARQCGVPREACEKRKKALQYGSLIHRALMRSRRGPGRPGARTSARPR